MKHIPLIFLLFCLVVMGSSLTLVHGEDRLVSKSEWTPEEIEAIALINEVNSAISTMSGEFVQIDMQGARKNGVFFISRPNRIRFKYAPPSRQDIISRGDGFFVIDHGEKTKVVYPQDKVPLRQFLTANINLFTANVSDVILTKNITAVSLFEDTQVGTVEVTLVFDRETSALVQWTLTEPRGDELTFSISNVHTQIDIPNRYFNIPLGYRSPVSK